MAKRRDQRRQPLHGIESNDVSDTVGFWVSAPLAKEHSRESWGFSSWAEATEFPGIWRKPGRLWGFQHLPGKSLPPPPGQCPAE